MKNSIKSISLVSLFITSLVSCGDDDIPVLINEEELITTVEYTMINDQDSNNVVVFSSIDTDGSGPLAPITAVDGDLRANSSYSGNLRFANESNPQDVEDITAEVREEALEHEVFYTTALTNVQITKTDDDSAGNSLGLLTNIQTGGEGTGELTITLVHLPKKPNNGSLTDALSTGGEEDVQVTFPIKVQ